MKNFLKKIFAERLEKTDIYKFTEKLFLISVLSTFAYFIISFLLEKYIDFTLFWELIPHGMQIYYSLKEHGIQIFSLLSVSIYLMRKENVYVFFRYFIHYLALAILEHFILWYIIEPGCITCSDSDGFETILALPIILIVVLVGFLVAYVLYKIFKNFQLGAIARDYLVFCLILLVVWGGFLVGMVSAFIMVMYWTLIIAVFIAIVLIIKLLEIAKKSRRS